MTTLTIDTFFVFSEKNNSYFHTEFGSKLNVVYGRNTSGKSTLIQLILYCFGVNDDRIRLTSILSEDIFVRVDCKIQSEEGIKNIVFLRKEDVVFIRYGDSPIQKFTGIDANNSVEHIKLKDFLHDIFGFKLFLESNMSFVKAPIETIFLPYYVAQSVGWVYLRKSFSNLDFYKNFKEDYLDYYLGIENYFDRVKKKELESTLRKINEEINFYNSLEKTNQDIKIAQIADEQLLLEAKSYVERFSDKQRNLFKLETDFLKKNNELSFFNQRLSVISKVRRNHEKQQPGEDNCPVCSQVLPSKTEDLYRYYQESNDTERELINYKLKVKEIQSEINSLRKKIHDIRLEVDKDFLLFKKYESLKITAETWLNNKANLKLLENITTKLGVLVKNQFNTKESLKEFKTDEEIKALRLKKTYIFKQLFKNFMSDMKLPLMEEDRFLNLYDITSFPFQGVELLQVVMCYHFAFNKLISETTAIHRFPFILDGVLKEDVDGVNRKNILNFVFKNKPVDTQTIISIADAKEEDSKIESYNKSFFNSEAKLICIGDGNKQRAIMSKYNNEHTVLLEDSFLIMEHV